MLWISTARATKRLSGRLAVCFHCLHALFIEEAPLNKQFWRRGTILLGILERMPHVIGDFREEASFEVRVILFMSKTVLEFG